MPIGLDKNKNKSEQGQKETVSNEALEVDDLVEDVKPEKKKSNKTIILIVIFAVLMILIFIGIISTATSSEDSTSEEQTEETSNGANEEGTQSTESQVQSNGVYDVNGNVVDQEAINPGIPDYDHSTNNSTTATVYSASDYIKDLNGVDVSAVYNVENIEYVYDYVSYETRRAIIDDGMELYWLEAVYEGKTYRIQAPYYYFKDLGTTGICKVKVEVLNLAGGGKIVSYMKIAPED